MKRIVLSIILIFIAIFYITIIKNDSDIIEHKALKTNAVILAYGDSLTYGFGVKKEFSYPWQLARKSGLRVINAGVSGEMSADGLKRLPRFLKQNPDLVILCHGGNDLLKKLSHEQLKNNLLAMISLIKQSGAEVLLVGVPKLGFTGLSIPSLYDEIAHETGVMYEDEIISEVEGSSAYKSDYIHPNKIGYEMMADAFLKILTKYNILDNTN